MRLASLPGVGQLLGSCGRPWRHAWPTCPCPAAASMSASAGSRTPRCVCLAFPASHGSSVAPPLSLHGMQFLQLCGKVVSRI